MEPKVYFLIENSEYFKTNVLLAMNLSYNLEFDSQNDKNALGIGSLVVFLVEKVRTIFVFSFVLKCFSFFFEE